MSTLPIEIIRQIVEDTVDDIDDLIYSNHISVLSLSCRLLRHVAQRVLFRDPALRSRPPAPNKTIMLLDTIISSPDRLALYVKTFQIGFSNWSVLKSAEFVKKLASALQTMRNLKSLAVDNRLDNILSLASVLDGVHFKLTSFRWYGTPGDVSSAARVKVAFLQHQDEIEHLAISAFIDDSTLQPIGAGMCPRLRSLSAPYVITQFILPQKKYIRSLQWVLPLGEHAVPEDPDIDNSFHLDLISYELANVRYLAYEDCNASFLPTAPPIRAIAPYLKSLVCLETEKRDIKLEALSQLPHLKILNLLTDRHDDLEEEELTNAAVACKSLERIDVEDDDGNFSSHRCNRSTKSPWVYTVDLDESQRMLWVHDYNMFDA